MSSHDQGEKDAVTLLPQMPRSDRTTDSSEEGSDTRAARREWPLPAALLLLSAIPVAAGAVRVTQLTVGVEITPEDARYFAAPVPVVVHIVGASLFSLLGAFQFAPGLRRRRPGWHRAAGRVTAAGGLAAGLSGLWMTLFHPHPDGVGDLLSGFRLVFGSAMVACIVLGIAAIRRRSVTRHRAWMIRGYAIGLGAGTQALTLGTWTVAVGTPGELGNALLQAAGWVINLAVAERVIRTRSPRPRLTSAGGVGPFRRRGVDASPHPATPKEHQ